MIAELCLTWWGCPVFALLFCKWGIVQGIAGGGSCPGECPEAGCERWEISPVASELCSPAQPGRCFGLEMSLLVAVEENMTCGCSPGCVDPTHVLSLLSTRLPFCFPKRLSISGIPILICHGWRWCGDSFVTASPFFASVSPTQSHCWESPGKPPKVVSTLLCMRWVGAVRLPQSSPGDTSVIHVRTRWASPRAAAQRGGQDLLALSPLHWPPGWEPGERLQLPSAFPRMETKTQHSRCSFVSGHQLAQHENLSPR